MTQEAPTAFQQKKLPEMYINSRHGRIVPTPAQAIEKIKHHLIVQNGYKARDARKKARELVFGLLNGTIDKATYDHFVLHGY